jgi:DNA-3-methyladenine glycosylase II
LALLILEQQVSLESGAAVFRRLTELAGQVTPEGIVKLSVSQLNEAGITRQKAGYIFGLAQDVLDDRFDIGALASMTCADALAALQAVKGIGPWTAQAYLLSAERLPDLFPIGDRALQVGTAEALGMTSVPKPDELEVLAEPWRPIRSVAARILWHGYLARRGRREPEQPVSVHGTPGPA